MLIWQTSQFASNLLHCTLEASCGTSQQYEGRVSFEVRSLKESICESKLKGEVGSKFQAGSGFCSQLSHRLMV